MKVEHDAPRLRIPAWRLLVVLGIAALGMICLLVTLWRVQVVESLEYDAAQLVQSFRHVEIPGLRGRILDRNGKILAENRPCYAVVLYCEEFRQAGTLVRTQEAIDAFIDQLANRLGLPREVSSKALARHLRRSLPVPLVLWNDVDYRTVAYLSEWSSEFPGVAIQSIPRRSYPNKGIAAQVLGYVGRAQTASESRRKWYQSFPEYHGRTGIEAQYDSLLSGTSGEELLRVDSRGYTRERRTYANAHAGSDLTLTLDLDLQRIAEQALNGRPGAVVALDPRNGDVLVLASAPTYDPNAFIPSISQKAWDALVDNPGKPFINRATQAQYAPGSVFKPFIALAALKTGFDPSTLHECTGVYTGYRLRLRCANRYGHGELDLPQAIMKSCNPYFCALGTEIGVEALLPTAREAGFGRETGIDLPGEADGFLPSPAWKQRTQHAGWTPADTALISIGQGAITATPLQVAHATATLAMHGQRFRPRLAAFGKQEGERLGSLPWSEQLLAPVLEGMEMVVSHGTGQTMQVKGAQVAGKTGTAEFLEKGVRRKHAWAVAYAPAEDPQIVVCAMLDDAYGGGRDAGPIVQKILAAHLKTQILEKTLSEEALED